MKVIALFCWQKEQDIVGEEGGRGEGGRRKNNYVV